MHAYTAFTLIAPPAPMNWFARRRADLSAEMEAHLAMAIRDRVARGESLAGATAAARREFGNREAVRAATRDMWRWLSLERLGHDLRYGLRVLRRAPVVYAIAVGVLAIGIGMNAAIYSIFRAFAVQMLPVSHPESLFRLRGGEASPGGAVNLAARMSGPDYRDIRARITTVKELAAFMPLRFQLEANGVPRTATADFVSGNYFTTLGIRPLLGRLLRDDDDRPGAPAPAAVISEAMWRSEFAARRDIVGQSLRVAGMPVAIVGVLPAPFVGLSADQPAGVWLPMGMYNAAAGEAGLLEARDYPAAMVFGRRPAGETNAAIASEVGRIARDLSRDYPDYHQRFRLEPSDGSRLLDEHDAGQSLQVLAIVWGVLLAIHLIACSNVASVLVARAVARRPEIATRLALGASRAAIVRQLMAESFLLAGAALLLGVAFAVVALRVIAARPLFAAFELRVDLPVLAAAAGVGMVTAFLFGLMPALESARTNLMNAMKGAASDGRASRRNRTSLFVTVQLVLSVTLLAMTGLALRVVRTATNVNPGFDVEHLMFANVSLRDSGSANNSRRYAAVYEALRAGIAAVPGVRAVTEAQDIPLSTHQMTQIMVVPGYAYGPRETNRLGFDNVAPGYFAAMGIRMVRGQDFDARRYGDSAYGLQNMVVNEAFARHYWPGRDPIGQQLLFKGRYPATVIGVVSDTRDRSLLTPGEPRYFIATAASDFALVVRTSGRAEAVAPMVRERIASLGLGINRPSVILGEDMRGQSLRAARIVSGGLTVLTGLALGLAALGLYGLVAFTMARSAREIGVRLALGARPRDIYSLASAITLRPALIGLLGGSVIAVGLARVAASLVAGAGALDLSILLGTVGALGAVVALSAFIPARRALRIEPIVALREN
jgi:putative ABC transport system permease protein